MYIPFRQRFDALFQGRVGLIWKMAGAAVVTALLVVGAIGREARDGELPFGLSPLGLAAVACVAAAAGAALAGGLALKDSAHRRASDGKPVNLLVKLYFGMGAWSLLAWFLTAPVVVFVITIITLI